MYAYHNTGSSIFGFVTMQDPKTTALSKCFLNGASHHPQSTFKAIVFGEAIHLRN